MSKIKVETIVRIKPYGMIEEAVRSGVRWGIHRAYKHSDENMPSDEAIERIVERAVEGSMSELNEILDFGDET